MPAHNNIVITNDLRELLYARFSSMIIKFYRKNQPSKNTVVCDGPDYVGAEFTSPDKKQCKLCVSLKYFMEHTQEVYNTIKKPIFVNKQDFVCEFF